MSAPVVVFIEVPRGSFVKRKQDGAVDFVSPLPSPFNYGSVEGELAADGDPFDALVLGPRLPLGARVEVEVFGEVDFVDAGHHDPKLVCSCGPAPRARDWLRVRVFFTVYARLKAALNWTRGRSGPTQLRGVIRGAQASPRVEPREP